MENSSNTLGLDFEQLKVTDATAPPRDEKDDAADAAPSSEAQPTVAGQDSGAAASGKTGDVKEKKKPYVNPDRVRTGGNQRDKLSEQALTERMARMKEQNEKIKQRRLDVQADEDAFRKTQESERIKQAHVRKVQENIDRTREQNAKRKMDKIQSREWDSGKTTGEWKKKSTPADGDTNETSVSPTASSPSGDGGRGGGRGRGRGRSRGRGGTATAAEGKTELSPPPPPPPATAATTTTTTTTAEAAV